MCVAELRGLGAVDQELKKRGGRLWAISVDPPRDSLQVVERLGLSFPILADTERQVIQSYGVVHAGGAPDGGDMAIPALFLINGEGRIVWRRVAKRAQDRPDPRLVIEAIHGHLGA